jgi:hypothetical protein
MADGMDPLVPIETAAGVWRLLIDQAGLEPDGWDADLVATLRAELSLQATGDVGEALEHEGVTVETFVNVFLEAVQSYAEMLEDLLAMFEQAGISATDENAAIEFDFDRASQNLRFDLKSFQAQLQDLREAPAKLTRRHWGIRDLWDLASAFSPEHSANLPQPLRAWADEWEAGGWPARLPAAPRTGIAAADAAIARAWSVWRWAVLTSSSLAPGGRELWERASAEREQRDAADPEETDVEVLGMAASDRWHSNFLGWLAGGLETISRAPDPEVAGADLARRVDAVLDRVTVTAIDGRALQQVLLDVLKLPFWKHRYDLYSAWVLTQLVEAAKPLQAKLVTDKGVLRFPFKPSRMATLPGTDPPLAIWAEIRTPLEHPLGDRVEGIQPDYSIVRNVDEPGAGDSVVEIECKQYKTPAYKSFGAALADYARGRPGAHVVLVDHGSMNAATLLGRPELKPYAHRLHAFADLFPRSDAAREKFRLLLRGLLWPYRAEVAEPAGTSAGAVRLTWTSGPADLDLHLKILTADSSHHVSYSNFGTLEEPPFARLGEDVMAPGMEEIEISRWLPATYALSVHAYTDRPLAGATAEVSLIRGEDTLTVSCPPSGAGRWWQVLVLDAASGALDVRNQLAEAPL